MPLRSVLRNFLFLIARRRVTVVYAALVLAALVLAGVGTHGTGGRTPGGGWFIAAGGGG